MSGEPIATAFDALIMAGRIACEATQSEKPEHWYHALECIVSVVDDVTEIPSSQRGQR